MTTRARGPPAAPNVPAVRKTSEGGIFEEDRMTERERPANAPGALPPSPEKRNDLWRCEKVFDYGPEENLEAWKEAAMMLEGFAQMSDAFDNEPMVVALTDTMIRAKEEVKRASAEVRMRREWAERQPAEADLL